MVKSSDRKTTLILARSQAGAEEAARLVTGDVVSVVAPDLTDDHRVQVRLRPWANVVVEANPDAEWLGPALALARSVMTSGSSIRLVLHETADESADTIAHGLSGWAISGVAVDGDVVSLHAVAASHDLEPGTTSDTVWGALKLAEILRLVSDPSTDLDEFEYRATLMMSYLTEIPRLHAQLEDLQAELKTARTTERELRHQFEMATIAADGGGSPSPTPRVTAKSRDGFGLRSRSRKLFILGAAALAWIGLAMVGTIALDAGSGGFLTLLAIGAIIAAILDNRRRAINLLRAARQSASAVGRLEGAFERYRRHTTASVRAIGGEVARHADATQRHTSQVGTQLAGAIASHSQNVISEVRTAAVDSKRVAAEQTGARNAEIITAITRGPEMRGMVRAELLIAYKQLEANAQLRDLVEVSGPTPPLRGWAASPDLLVFLIQELLRLRPALVVECGSGASTVWLAMACRSANLATRVVALEHDTAFAAETSQLLEECSVAHIAEVRHAPLDQVMVNNRPELWYRLNAVEDLTGIGLLFVDGPPAATSEEARYPALPLLRSRLASKATIVLDDMIRQQERAIADSWETEYPEFERRDYPFEKGAAVFRLGSANPDHSGGSELS